MTFPAPADPASTPSLPRGKALAAAVAIAAALGAGFAADLPSHVADVDVLLYASAAARAHAEGAPPYVAAWIEKGPLAMGLYQALFAVFGMFNMLAVAVTWLLTAGAATALSWALAREIGRPSAGPWAAAVYVVAVGPLGGTLNTELPASALAALAVLGWCRANREARVRPGAAFLVGLAVAGAMMCRQNAGALWPLLCVASLLSIRGGRRTLRGAVVEATALTLGFLSATGVVVASYAAIGHLETLVFCVYGYNTEIYVAATRVDAARLLASPWTAFRSFLLPSPVTGLAGLAGCGLAVTAVARGRTDPAASAGLAVATAALGLTASLFIGLRFFAHYFAVVLPLWAALGGMTVDALLARFGPRGRRAVAAIVLVSLAAGFLDRPWRGRAYRIKTWLAGAGEYSLGDALYWPGRDGHAAVAARYIRENGDPTDRIFVWGKRPHLYVFSRRIPSTRFVTCTFLTGLVPWERSAPEDDTTEWIVPGSWDLLMSDLEAEPPEFIVDAARDHMFGAGGYDWSRFPRLAAFVESRYEKVLEAGDDDRLVVWRIAPAQGR